jgi:hypothetical protein
LLVFVSVECDQTKLQTVTLRYYLGNEQQMERMAVADSVVNAPDIIAKHWGLILQESVWSIVQSWIDADTPAGKSATGFAIGTDGKLRTKAGRVNEAMEVVA